MPNRQWCLSIVSKLAITAIGLLFVSFLAVMALIYHSSLQAVASEVDAVLILGAGLDGDKPREVLQERLNTSLYYVYDSDIALIIASGGQGHDETISEAEAMKRFLVASGTDPSRIIKEEQSTSTRENVAFSAALIRERVATRSPRVLIVTSSFHLFRAKQLAKEYGLVPYGIGARTPKALLPRYLIREYLAIINDLVVSHRG